MNSYKTAIRRKKPSVPATILAKEFSLESAKVLDWGCGHGADLAFYESLAQEVCGYDPHWAPTLPANKYNVLACMYVANVLEDPKPMLLSMLEHATPGALVFVSARSKQHIDKLGKRSGWTSHKKGWLTKANTFQCGFSQEELDNLLKSCNILVTNRRLFISNGVVSYGIY